MTDGLTRIGQALDTYIRPQTFPVAVRVVGSAAEIPGKARMPKRDLGRCIALCQGTALARRHGWLIAMGEEDMLCPIGALSLGFLPAKERFLDGSSPIPFWVKNQDVRAKMAQSIPKLDLGRYTHVVVAPLPRTEFEPNAIIVYGDPAQVARLIQAAVYSSGEPITSSTVGGFACGQEITVPMLTDKCQLVVAGGGDRAVAQTHDHEIAFAIPMSKLEMIAEGLEGTHKAGLRYPTPALLPLGVGLPPSFDELMGYLREGN